MDKEVSIANANKRLATIEIVSRITPIENADKIELAVAGSVNVCVSRGEFKVGDKVILIRVSSIVPAKKEFDFLEKYEYVIVKRKIQGVWSKGILLSVDSFPQYKSLAVGEDITSELGITRCMNKKLKQNVQQRQEIGLFKLLSNELSSALLRACFLWGILIFVGIVFAGATLPNALRSFPITFPLALVFSFFMREDFPGLNK